MSLAIADRENTRFDDKDALDPSDKRPYTLDFSTILSSIADDEVISSVTHTLSSDATSAGVEKDSETNDNSTATVTLKVNASNQSDAAWDGDGTWHTYTAKITTNNAHTIERTAAFNVRQR